MMAEALAPFEAVFRLYCECDMNACAAPELEELSTMIGPLCCNADFYSGPPLAFDCTDVATMSFMDFLMSEDDEDANPRELRSSKKALTLS